MKYGNVTINIYIDGIDVEDEVNNECPTEGEDLLINLKKDVDYFWSEAVDEAAKEVELSRPDAEGPVFSIGDRVCMLGVGHEVPVGAVGTVAGLDGYGCVCVKWDGFTKGHNNDGSGELGPFWWVVEKSLEKLTLKEGALVVFTGRDPDEENVGFAGISLIGKIGVIIISEDYMDDDEFKYLVEFEGWTDGHDGDYAEDGSKSRWWCNYKQLEVIG